MCSGMVASSAPGIGSGREAAHGDDDRLGEHRGAALGDEGDASRNDARPVQHDRHPRIRQALRARASPPALGRRVDRTRSTSAAQSISPVAAMPYSGAIRTSRMSRGGLREHPAGTQPLFTQVPPNRSASSSTTGYAELRSPQSRCDPGRAAADHGDVGAVAVSDRCGPESLPRSAAEGRGSRRGRRRPARRRRHPHSPRMRSCSSIAAVATRPFCTARRMITCTGDFPYRSPIACSTGLSRSPESPAPSGLYDSVTMPCASPWYSRCVEPRRHLGLSCDLVHRRHGARLGGEPLEVRDLEVGHADRARRVPPP